MTPNAPLDEVVAGFLEKKLDLIKREYAPSMLLVFGSRARGTAAPDSDIDLMIVSERFEETRYPNRMGEFLNRYPELSSVIHEFLGLFRIFIAPLDADQRTRERIEAAIAGCLYEQPGIIGGFQENDAVYRHRRPDEEPIAVLLRLPKPILGLRTELIG